jgi:hypothetical protein
VNLASQVDHLVVAADSLAQGVAWCEATLGVTPEAGGKHAFMGTHNRLLLVGAPQFPLAYLEILAIDPDAPDPGRKRWFDLDDPDLREAIRQEPRLVHFVASCERAAAGTRALAGLGIERGTLLPAERQTPLGLLQWKIGLRDDGQRLFYGMLPTLIEWGQVHPADGLPESPVALLSLAATHPRPDDLSAAYAAIGLGEVAVRQGPPNLAAAFSTPRGEVTLESKGI